MNCTLDKGGMMMGQELLNRLVELLEHEYEIFQNLLELSQKKTDIIVEGKVSELDKLVKLEQSIVLQISKLEAEREEIVKKIAQEFKIEDANLKISELKKYVNEENMKILEEYQNKMMEVIDKLNHVNQLNSKLVKNALEYIEFSFNLLSNVNSSHNYTDKGDISGNTRKNLLDIKL